MDTQTALRVYKDLADHYEGQKQASMRDRFLVLAADAALEAGSAAEAEHLRQRLLKGNPHHLLKPYKSFAEAIRAPDVQTYVRDLRLNYPLETAENLLRSLRAEDLLSTLRQEENTEAPAKARPAPAPPVAPPAEKPIVYRLRPEDTSPQKPRAPAEPQYHAVPCEAPPGNAARKDPPLAKPVAKPVPPAKAPRAAPPARPAPSARPAAPPAESPPGGSWFVSALFGFFVMACAALAAYTLARPFLPREWLP